MILKYIILALLRMRPMTGYDLQKKIESTINYFWPSTQSQIYRSLKELTQDGSLEVKAEIQEGRPNKKNYTVTDRGKGELDGWLSRPVDIPNHRSVFLVQLFFSKNLDPAAILANLKAYEEEMAKRYDFLTSEEVRSRTADSRKLSRLINEIVVENGVMALETELRWIRHARERINQIARTRG